MLHTIGKRSWRRRAERAGIVLATIGTLFVLLAETYLRFTWVARFPSFTEILREDPDSPLPWRLIPGATWNYRGFTDDCLDTDIRINALGFRDTYDRIEKAPGTYRILCLGDSDTFGQGVELHETYPKVLEEMLRGREYHNVEVWNRGVPGYDLDDFSVLLSELWVAEPDLIVLELCDVEGVNKRKGFVFDTFLFRHSMLYRLLFVLRINALHDREAGRSGIRDFARQCDERGVPLLLFEMRKPPRYLLEMREEFLRNGNGAYAWISQEAFGAYEDLPCDPHPNPNTHSRVAQGLIPHVVHAKETRVR